MKGLEQAKLLSIASKFAKAETAELGRRFSESTISELEKAKLLSVATKLAKAEIAEVRNQFLEQINSIKLPEAIVGREGRSIVDARLIEGALTLEFSDGGFVNVGNIIGQQGSVGPIGPRGDKGDIGSPGPRGDRGEQGIPGIEGPRGIRGDKGEKGDTGDQGERGEQGPEGIPGKRGQQGERGEQGTPGLNGAAGSIGAKGAAGEAGSQGLSGRDGKNGKDGKNGLPGPVGPEGPKGDKGDTGSDADVSKLEKKLEQFEQDVDKRISKVAFNTAMTGASPGSGEVLLHRLDDVDYTTVKNPNDGQALVWNVAIGKWAAGTVAGGGATNVAPYLQVANAVATYSTKAYAAANSYVKSTLANTNLYIATKSSWTALTSTNTALRALISDSIQVANAAAIYATKSNPTTSGLLAHTGRATISTNLEVSGNTVIGKLVANGSLGTSGYSLKSNGSTVYWDAVGAGGSSGATWAALTSTNTALRTLVSDRLQVANAASIYQTKAIERAALANTNLAITNVKTGLTSTNTAIRTLVSDRYQVANVNTLLAAKATWAGLTATNTAIRTLVSDRLQVANAAATYLTKNNPVITGTLTANASVGTSGYYLRTSGTGVYWSPTSSGSSGATWAALTGTNTAIRTLVSDRLQVANAVATYQTKTVERAALANTNLRINLVNTNLTGTNTAIRALTTTKLAVANAFTQLTKYAANTSAVTTIASSVKLNDALTANPTGLLAITLPDGSIVKIPYWA